MKTAALITHTHPHMVAEAVKTAGEIADEQGWHLYSDSEAVEPTMVGISVTDELPADPDLCLVLGGDGTILYALRSYVGSQVPVFGINHGTVGFLSAFERDQLRQGLMVAFSEGYETISLPGLEISGPDAADGKVAFNDLSLIRRPHGRMAELSYSIGTENIGDVRCDGLVVSTSTGSTGYNLANGGPILAWGVQGYVVSYISPHILTSRPLVVGPEETLMIANAAGREPVELEIDGQPSGELSSGRSLRLQLLADTGRLAQVPGHSFYQRISDKFGHLAH